MTASLWRGVGLDGREAHVAASSAEGAARALGRALGDLRGIALIGVPSGGAWVAPGAAAGGEGETGEITRAVVERSAALHGVRVSAILGPGRSRRVSVARVACYWALRRAGWSYPEVARAMDRHHSTVVAALSSYEPAPELARALESVVLSSASCPSPDPESES